MCRPNRNELNTVISMTHGVIVNELATNRGQSLQTFQRRYHLADTGKPFFYTNTLPQGSSEIDSLATVSELPPVADAVGDGLGAGVISKMGT